jgi:hypothetical protein
MGRMGNAYRNLIERPYRKHLTGRPRRRWEDNIKMNLKEICCEGGKWMELAQDNDQCWVLVLTGLKLGVLLLGSQSVSQTDRHTHIHTHMHTYTCIRTYTYTYIIHIHIYTYIHIYIRTYVRTYIMA